MIYEVEVNDSFATANFVPQGEVVAGQLSSRFDYDYFKFKVSAAGIITVTITEPVSNKGSYPGYSYSIYDPNFVLLGTGYGSGVQTYIPAQAIATLVGDYYVAVSYNYIAPTGIYQLNISVPQVALVPTYSLVANSSTVAEGGTATFVLSTTNVSSGTAVAYSITGISSTDLISGSLTGNVVIGSDGKGAISLGISADKLTEGDEVLTLTTQNKSASITILDTSTTPAPLVTNETHTLSVIVNKGVLSSNAVLLKGLNEKMTLTNGIISLHTVEYAGTTYDFNSIDSLITTVIRDSEFTAEFKKELTDFAPSTANLTYKDAVLLVGSLNIDTQLLLVAGFDGNFVG
jgi:hypothetical protein